MVVSIGAVAARFGTSVVNPQGSQGVRTEFSHRPTTLALRTVGGTRERP